MIFLFPDTGVETRGMFDPKQAGPGYVLGQLGLGANPWQDQAMEYPFFAAMVASCAGCIWGQLSIAVLNEPTFDAAGRYYVLNVGIYKEHTPYPLSLEEVQRYRPALLAAELAERVGRGDPAAIAFVADLLARRGQHTLAKASTDKDGALVGLDWLLSEGQL